ncbi:MAG: hypothetical protein CBE00_09185 [Planctomycetaceae bacterium TMED240]|nr:MAG: hypothetical protein CBE00_09185 [Planctomycetaceae bacterium TMED240]
MNHALLKSNQVKKSVSDGYVIIEDEAWYQIANVHLMPEFFMSPVSSGDHWMFISSCGALTAGRRNPDASLFPYYSSDKLIDHASFTGAKTIIRKEIGDGRFVIWEPFAQRIASGALITRNLYKNWLGNRVLFEEINQELGLAFSYSWTFSNRFGFVRKCKLRNVGQEAASVVVLDGIQNLLPAGIEQNFQLRYSNLGDAYKKSELSDRHEVGIYYLSSIPTDRAEPSEGLRATIAWQTGLDESCILLSAEQLDRFRDGLCVEQESDVRGRRGAYFTVAEHELPVAGDSVAGDSAATSRVDLGSDGTDQGNREGEVHWSIVANVNCDQTDVVNLMSELDGASDLTGVLDQDVVANERRLLAIVSAADGRQSGGDWLRVQRHQSNVLFNVMRGGIPRHQYCISAEDFRQHLFHFNRKAADRNPEFLDSLSAESALDLDGLLAKANRTNDADLRRIALEYLPLTYSRRHGDPTRPWNSFSIDFFGADGTESLCYEGNWRDIFQNWEALSWSFPKFSRSMVFRFLNASTADGYNPYRVNKDGFEWETIDPKDPWGNIGYWGDHQIVYLLKLLECSQQFCPTELDQWLTTECCSYAQVPYRIRDYQAIKRDPRETIDFDHELADLIEQRVSWMGADGKLLPGTDGMPHHVTMLEKLLLPALVKVSNFVPGGGVWLNTQRPEWNDANNALVGSGLSVVTACYLRRYCDFMMRWLSRDELPETIAVSREVTSLFGNIAETLGSNSDLFSGDLSDAQRMKIVDALSQAGSDYRQQLYDAGLSGEKVELSLGDCVSLLKQCLRMIDHTIHANRRTDGLYHSYNLIGMQSDGYGVTTLQEMLEGQVAVLNSGLLSAEEAVQIMDALQKSSIYREDQQSYMLYPDRELATFLTKNNLDEECWKKSKLLQRLIADENVAIVRQDSQGGVHFSGDFRNVGDLRHALNSLTTNPAYASGVAADADLICDIFERTFCHKSFTGRSGTFFAYEGLGSIYWHMVSKLALTAIENCIWSQQSNGPSELTEKLLKHYRIIRDGIGLAKSPAQYGAFPADPYSHTPQNAGVQQPGMTGQVKEDIISRFTELGVRIQNGQLGFDPCMLEVCELLHCDSKIQFVNRQDEFVEIELPAGSFAFTLCQTPVVYHQATEAKLVISALGMEPEERFDLLLTPNETKNVFSRTGVISRIDVFYNFRQSC